jgi:cell division protein YceG involved in septum cleavage
MISKRIKIIIPILVICCLLLAVYFWIGIYQPKESGSAKSVTFSIQRGEGSREIALNLEKANLIKWESSFRVYVYFKGVAG